MSKSFSCLISFLSLLFFSCSGSENYQEAYGYQEDGESFIKIKGKRKWMGHDPGSVLSNDTYEDSVILQVPSLQDGTIKGEVIPVRKGRYKYLGEIAIEGKKVQINLSYDNTDDKKIEPTSWNGVYNLVRN
jgi:hypothetical protein